MLAWFTVIHSMNKFFTTIDFHEDVFIWNCNLFWLNWSL